MTLRCAGAQWRLLVHERHPGRGGTSYGTAHSIASTAALAGSEGEHQKVHVFGGTEFDEVVAGSFLHAEQMGPCDWWVNAGGFTLDVHTTRDGKPVKVIAHGPENEFPGCEYADESGDTALMVSEWERAKLIDALMVLMRAMEQVPENDLSEMPQLQALLERLMEPQTVPPEQDAAWREMVALGQEIGGD